MDEPNGDVYIVGMPLWERSLAMFREIGDAQGIADAAWGLAQGSSFQGDEQKALDYGQQALDGYKAVDDQFGLGWALFILGGIHVRGGRIDKSEELFRESMASFVSAGDKTGILLNVAAYLYIAQTATATEPRATPRRAPWRSFEPRQDRD